MASPSSSVNYREAAQVAAVQVLSPENVFSTMTTTTLAKISCFGIDLASKGYRWAKETQCFYKLLYQDLQKLLDDADVYQTFLEMEQTLVSDEQIALNLSQPNIELAGFVVLPNEILELIFSHLSIENIAQFAQTSKCCYLATKTDSIWKSQLNKLYPEMEFLPRDKYRLSPEQQVKIIYRKTFWPLKLSYEKLKNYTETINQKCQSYCPPFDEKNVFRNFEHQELMQLVEDSYDETDTLLDHLIQRTNLINRIGQLKKDCETFAKPEEFRNYMIRARSALDIQERLKDFPERVNKMKEIVDKDVFTDVFIRTAIESRCYAYSTQFFACTEAFAKRLAETIQEVCGGNAKNLAKSRLDQMLQCKH